ncbi:hypothetical protein DFS33DRAFT_1372078 [Desarmillaria ectypa]|nr:hypothetical protein DFS33DRAFT_1372078 [Desarmillaria ectypa]
MDNMNGIVQYFLGKLSSASPFLSRSNDLQQCTLPVPVSASTARTYLKSLTIEVESNSPAYDRDLFNHWIIIWVLARDATSIIFPLRRRGDTLVSDLDIDHVVPLKEAWVSGARYWTDDEREDFANDLSCPQMDPLDSYVCTYVRAWVTVKHYYDLSVDQDEYDALTDYLADC